MRQENSLGACSAAFLLAISLIAAANARIITVDDDGEADFNNIRAAMDYAVDGDTVVIRPSRYTGQDNRNIDFGGKAVIVRSIDPGDANIVESTIIDCEGLGRAFQFVSGEKPSSVLDGLTILNGLHQEKGGAIYCVDSGPTIMNCRFTNNNAKYGGAIRYESESHMILIDCFFAENSAERGGAVYFWGSDYGSLPIGKGFIKGCVFCDNSGTTRGGGGLYLVRVSSLTATDSTFIDNWGNDVGGSIYYYGCSALSLRNCLFSKSLASVGGALYGSGGNASIEGCRFVGNSATEAQLPYMPGSEMGGGALMSWGEVNIAACLFAGNSCPKGGALALGGSDARIVNCTFAGNYAEIARSIYAHIDDRIGLYSYPPIPSRVYVENSILWDGESSVACDDQIAPYESTIDFSFCNVIGAPEGQGNIYADPCFTSPGHWGDANDPDSVVEPNDPNAVWVHGDFNLKSQGGRWDSNEGRWVRDDVTSLCIDSGNPANPVGSEAFPNGGIVNMGFYGGTAEASKSYFGQPPCETIVTGDVNGDCAVDARDFAIMAGHWLSDNTICLPERATNPYPPDGATGVETDLVLNWAAGPGAVTHDVCFGITSPGLFQGNKTEPNLGLWTLDYDQTYYWRIDEINDVGTTTGAVWSFRTEPRPLTASHPSPPDGATITQTNPILRWEAGRGALSHDVYFGEESPGIFQGNQETTSFEPGNLFPYTTYYWRVDEVNESGTTTGPVWSFTFEPSKARSCFPGGTPVWINGEMVEISEVVGGATVDKAAVGHAITDVHRTVCGRQIEGVDVHEEFGSWERYDIEFENGNTLAVADSHYFLLESGKWASVQELAVGSKLATLEGSVTVRKVKKSMSSGTVYNLKIKDSDRYLVGKDGIIVRDW